ncbi:lipase [Arthrobacter sp. MYb227]|uniref:alpha/beta hydrolase family protein n=1 Tax=Arthrobacter sp. MYb227 TaxID=1848601 RepID=UPI000CFB6413|nr:alpha/beta fold hydrolase [Arthrobacter sp. MYb227]PQZ95796.1 lipase [Arthrobacter sp. MYb227]
MKAQRPSRRPSPKTTGKGLSIALVGAGIGAVAGSLFAGSVSALAAYFARRVVTPDAVPEESLAILAVLHTEDGYEVILPATKDSTAPGRYSLFFAADTGHARLGEPKDYRVGDGTVTRIVEEVYSGDIGTAARGRLSGVIFDSPADAGIEFEEVQIPTENGDAPAWLIPGVEHKHVWAICVHGRGANRKEGIRALSTLGGLGLTSLLVSYRNDGIAPAAIDGRYGLGGTEWPDIEAAIDFALARGANEIMLFGWSMGGAVSLQLADKSSHARKISALVLDGPVINWIDVLSHQAKLNRIPEAVGQFAQWLLSNKAGRWMTGLAAPLDLKELNWVEKHDQLRIPTLILHSEDDDFVPIGPSEQLAELNPQTVTLKRYTRAGHTREWNVDPQRWDREVSAFVRNILNSNRPGFDAEN